MTKDPRLLHPATFAGKGPRGKGTNFVRTLAMGDFGKVALALAVNPHSKLTEPPLLPAESLVEWRDAIAEEILLLAQDEPRLANELSGSFGDCRPFRHGPNLRELMGLNGAVAVLPVDTSDPGDPHKQGAWMHLWLICDPKNRLAEPDDRHRLEGAEEWDALRECKLYTVTSCHTNHLAGRSWQLGAFLAERALDSEVKRQLAVYWIITGEVQNGEVTAVHLGNKTNIPWFDSGRSWLLPDQNLTEAITAASAHSEFRPKSELRFFGVRTVKDAAGLIRHQRVIWVTTKDGSPFVGLNPYEARHSRVFFGRTEAIERCLRFLGEASNAGCAFLLVVGESGSGKSSLVRAGLAPRIAESGDIDWVTAVFRPGNDPLASLVETLAAALRAHSLTLANWEDEIAHDPERAIASLVRMLGPTKRLLVVVDQLEDAFHLPNDGSPRESSQPAELLPESSQAASPIDKFVEAISALARSGSARVLATLRADEVTTVLSSCEPLRELTKAGAIYYVVPPEFHEVIRRPVEAAGFSYDKRTSGRGHLGDVLYQDVQKAGPDALPLLQMTLELLYEARDEKSFLLTFAAYEAIGRLEGAIALHAEGVLRDLDEASREELRRLLLVLAGLRPDGSLLLRRVSHADWVTSAARRVLVSKMVDARLLVVNEKGEMRLTHEALLRKWNFADEALKKEASVMEIRDYLKQHVEEWLKNGRDKKDLLEPGGRLDQAYSVLDRLRVHDPTGEMIDFVQQSQEKAAKVQQGRAVRMAAAWENLNRHIRALEFPEAKAELKTLENEIGEGTYNGQGKEDILLGMERVGRLSRFYMAALDAERLSGEEDFPAALERCTDAWDALAGEEDIASAYRALKAFGASAERESAEVERLEQAAYRVRLLFSLFQLVPGIRILFSSRSPEPKPIFDWKKLAKLAKYVPQGVLRALLMIGGGPFARHLRRRGNDEARNAFKHCSEVLAHVQEIEKEHAREKGEKYDPSRTSFVVGQIASLLSDFADGPEGSKINCREWLRAETPATVPKPVSGVDYFYIGLFNYFIAKRRDGLIAKTLALLQGIFPDLDGRTPFATAERLLRTAIARDRKNFWSHWLLGRTLQTDQNYGGAELAFNAAIALSPEYARGWEQLALTLGHQWLQTKDEEVRLRAEAASNTALQVAAGDPSIFWPRGELLQLLGRVDDAVDAYSRWLELEKNINALISRATGVGTLYDLAGALISQATTDNVRADAYALLALVYMTWAEWRDVDSPNQNRTKALAANAALNLAEALKAADAALKLNAAHARAWTVKGVVLRQQAKTERAKTEHDKTWRHKTEQALEALRCALDYDEFAYRAALNVALALEDAGKKSEALAAWDDLTMRADKALKLARESGKDKPARELCPPWIEEIRDAARGQGAADATPA